MEYTLYRPADHEQRRFESAHRPERRYLTIMFCDLVNSTHLTTELEPEDLMYLLQAYRHLSTEIIKSHDGFTASFIGDGIMSIFGYPRTHEDDAERATSSALALLNAVKTRKSGADDDNWNKVSIRIGIASGLVVVGNSGIYGGNPNQIVIGEPPNLAARLQSAAKPDTVIVCGNTRSLIEHAFNLEYVGASSLRGYKTPQRLWQVTATATLQTRFCAAGPLSSTELTGRETEYARLIQLWKLSRLQGGRVALISGETGTGKTKLLEALCSRVSAECPGPLILQRLPNGTNDPVHHYLAQLLAADGLTPENIPAKKILQGKADLKRPGLIILEDAHRCGMTSLALVDKLIALVRRKQILLAISHRVQFQPPQKWSLQQHVENIHLGPLNRAAAMSFIHRFTGAEQIPARVISAIISRCDGIPLFLEELTRAALEAQRPALETVRTLRGASEIPDKVWAVLMARLDRQHPASREAAQIGAVLGRKFGYSLLAEIWSHNKDNLDHALHSLCRSGELLKRGNAGNTCYIFKWVLMREVAYLNTLRRVRQNLYRRIMRVHGLNVPAWNIYQTGEK